MNSKKSNENKFVVSNASPVYDEIGTFTVPTFNRHKTRDLKTTQIKINSLESLKELDPFMYYSLPGVRDTSVFFNGGEREDVCAEIDENTSPDQMNLILGWIWKMKNVLLAGQAEDETIISQVSRKSRLSFEYHVDVFMQDLMEDENVRQDDEAESMSGLLLNDLTSTQQDNETEDFASTTNGSDVEATSGNRLFSWFSALRKSMVWETSKKVKSDFATLQEDKNTRVATEDHPHRFIQEFFETHLDDEEDLDEYILLALIETVDTVEIGRARAA